MPLTDPLAEKFGNASMCSRLPSATGKYLTLIFPRSLPPLSILNGIIWAFPVISPKSTLQTVFLIHYLHTIKSILQTVCNAACLALDLCNGFSAYGFSVKLCRQHDLHRLYII
jgi:hypothetical protein